MIELVRREWHREHWNIMPPFGEWEPTGWKIVVDPDSDRGFTVALIEDFGFEIYRAARPMLTSLQLNSLMTGELVLADAWQYVASHRGDVGGLNASEIITIYRQFGSSGRLSGAPYCDHPHTTPRAAFECPSVQVIVSTTTREQEGVSAAIILASDDNGRSWRKMTLEEVGRISDGKGSA